MEKLANKKSVSSSKSHKASKNTQQEKSTLINQNYFSFEKRFVFVILMFLISYVLCLFVATKTIEKEKTNPITYTDMNQIKYKVYLKENELYKEKYLGMNRAYVANLIDNINIDYDYMFNIGKETNMDFTYKIIAELIIENSKGTNFVDEKYTLKESEMAKLNNGGTFAINENVVIDYGYYNRLANKFKTETGIDITGYLNIYLEVQKETDKSLNYKIHDITKSNIKIPLSERAIEINFDSNNNEITKQVIPTGKSKFNLRFLIYEIILFAISLISLVGMIKYAGLLMKPKKPYDKYVNKILKNYDRMIVETKTAIDISKYNIIEIRNFSELLDVRDNLKLPIIYYNIVKHEKGIFYIKNNLDIYSYVVKGIDLEK